MWVDTFLFMISGHVRDEAVPALTEGENRDEEVPKTRNEVEVEAVEGQDEEKHENECEDLELNTLPEENPDANLTQKKVIQWCRTPYTPGLTRWEDPAPEVTDCLTPYGYFKQYLPQEMFEQMTTMTNTYAEKSAVMGYKIETEIERLPTHGTESAELAQTQNVLGDKHQHWTIPRHLVPGVFFSSAPTNMW